MKPLLDDKICIVTGGASGIGRATVQEILAEGGKVVIADINGERLEAASAELAEHGPSIETVCADLGVKTDVEKVVAAALARFGRIDAVINSHGLTHRLDTIASETPEEIFDLTITVNLKSVFLLCGAVLPHMRAHGGSIVNISSIGALIGWGGISYTASKGGLTAMTRQIAYQEAANNIRCNTILPGTVETEMVAVLGTKQHMATAPTIPGFLGRRGTPKEIANLAVFLASDRASYITGASYVIDGGLAQH